MIFCLCLAHALASAVSWGRLVLGEVVEIVVLVVVVVVCCCLGLETRVAGEVVVDEVVAEVAVFVVLLFSVGGWHGIYACGRMDFRSMIYSPEKKTKGRKKITTLSFGSHC